MKPIIIPLAIALLSAGGVGAQQVRVDNFQHLKVHYETSSLHYDDIQADGGKYALLTLDGYRSGGEVGQPTLPVLTSLLTVPLCDGYEVRVENAVYDTLHGLSSLPLYPLQNGRFKSGEPARHLARDEAVYATDGFVGQPLASLNPIGIARDRNLAQLTFSPVRVNPVSGAIEICRSADIEVRYVAPDTEATLDLYRRHHNPVFSAGASLNRLIPTKEVAYAAPLRMVVVAPNELRCKKLDEFISWKRDQGLMTDIVYTDDMGLLSSALIAAYLNSLYTGATEEEPAPTFVLMVGDDNLMPSFNSQLSNSLLHAYGLDGHLTDLYYVTWTEGDIIPDAYFGRFSARDTTQLGSIVDKTLLYEQYRFADDSYLERGALVAGIDAGRPSDEAYRCSDPTMDYIAKCYLNADNGFSTLYYYKNNTDFAPAGVTVTGSSQNYNTAATLRGLYDEGLGWVNYSAHGDEDRWYQPSLLVSDIANMSNTGKPSFMIGNCCLTNYFQRETCFGEALLRQPGGAGAVAYIGATNSTLWDEDFYWSVGVRTRITGTMDPEYDSTHRGMYDHLFHTHGEPHSATIATAGQMIMAGDMSVNATLGNSWSNTIVPYYWEIYMLMGDPSLIPWTGRAAQPEVSLTATDRIYITTTPHAYVALVENGAAAPVEAVFADATGHAELAMPSDAILANSHLSITAQGHRPYSFDMNNLGIDDAIAVESSLYPNPASDWCTVAAADLRSVEVLNLNGMAVATYMASGDSFSLPVAQLQPGLYMVRITTARGSAIQRLVVR